jgi:hypothetical protein
VDSGALWQTVELARATGVQITPGQFVSPAYRPHQLVHLGRRRGVWGLITATAAGIRGSGGGGTAEGPEPGEPRRRVPTGDPRLDECVY